MASETATFRFVDAHPVQSSKRDQELMRAEALSHAAKVGYARKVRQTELYDDCGSAAKNPASAAVSANAPPRGGVLLTKSAPVASKAPSKGPPRHSIQPWQRFSQKGVPFHRFRAGPSQPTRRHTGTQNQAPRPTEDEEEEGQVQTTAQALLVRSFVPNIHGSSDPFNATVIRLTPMEHVLLQQARDQLIWSMWHSEIAIRQNKAAITHSSWKIVPPTLHDKSANFALVAQSYYSRAAMQRAAGLPPDKGLVQAEKYKFQALRGLQELLELNRQAPGDRQRLRGMFLTCCWLAGSELLCYNWDAAEMH